MQLLYSGAESDNALQFDPNLSLGGFISSSPIPNGKLNNIFPPISRQIASHNIGATRLIVLKNGGQDVTNLKVWTERGNLSSYQIALVAPALNTKGQKVFEAIYDSDSIPYQATLEEKDGFANAIDVTNVSANDTIGIWIRRNLDLDNFTQLDGVNFDVTLPCSELETLLTEDANLSIDDGTLKIQWD